METIVNNEVVTSFEIEARLELNARLDLQSKVIEYKKSLMEIESKLQELNKIKTEYKND